MKNLTESRVKFRREHLGIDELSKKDFEYAEKYFGLSKEVILSLEENDEKRREIVDYLFEIETDEVFLCIDDYSKFSERGKRATKLVDALTYFPPEEHLRGEDEE